MNLYLYKMVVDDGGAPCVTDSPRLLSLALCKPSIRRTAAAGDLIFAFAGNTIKKTHPDNPLIYVAKVTSALCGERYYSSPEYCTRPDCIYRYDGLTFDLVERARSSNHHKEAERAKDVGRKPLYRNARILLSEKFRYFGNGGPRACRQHYPKLAGRLEFLTDGHAVNHDAALVDELLRFKDDAWRRRGLRCTQQPPWGSAEK